MKFKTMAIILSVMALSIISGCGDGSAPENKPVSAQTPAPAAQTEEPDKVEFLQYYLPSEKIDFALYKKPDVQAKSIYVSGAVAATPDLFENRIDVCKQTEINSMVIDIKEADGLVYFKGIDFADELGASKNFIPDIKDFLKRLKDENIYTIGRLVTFKDNNITDIYPEFGLKLADGTIFRERPSKDKDGNIVLAPAWLNPYNRDVWEYTVSIAKGAAELGFDEIQFDYFRFPTSSKIDDAQFGDTGGLSRTEIIAEFGKYAVEQLSPYGVKVSVDVYGTIILSSSDADIVGQNYVELCKIFDFVCPMLYPSHFATNTMDIDYPDLRPYDTIYRSLVKSNEKLEGEEGIRAVIRPWLQDFTASYLKSQGIPYQEYTGKQVREQIQACYDSGHSEWLLWGSGRSNSVEGLLPE